MINRTALSLAAGEDRTYALKARTAANAVLNLTGATLTWRLKDGNGGLVREVPGTVTTAALGLYSVVLSDANTELPAGDYSHETFAVISGATTICNAGILRVAGIIGRTPQILPGAVVESPSSVTVESREQLTTNRIYYVRTDGNDANDGLTDNSVGAFLTIQHAANAALGLDCGPHAVTILLGGGTYTSGVTLYGPLLSSNVTPLTIQGDNATPANCVISTISANCLAAVNGAVVYITGVEFRTATAGDCVLATNDGQITIGNVRFGSCAAFHKEANTHGRILNNGNYTIVGSAAAHQHCTDLGYILNLSCTITLTGTPAFSSFFDGVSLHGSIHYVSCTFSGSATGQRFLAHDAGNILATGQSDTYLPGNAAGVRDTGGQFIGTNGGTAFLTQGAQWSSSNYGLSLAIAGGRHNAIGWRDATGNNPWAVANVSGVFTFAKMEAFYGISSPPDPCLSLMTTGSTKVKSFAVASLPASPSGGEIAFASNGRKNGEGAGVGTGVLVFGDGTAWRACDTGATVAA